ncbi:hypothetical protein BM1374166_02160 [Bartonella tribocorum]|nr:hypothetical protein BM1374166_02160 [Bartonella tribocorum]
MDTIPENTQDTRKETPHKKHRILQTTMRIIFTIIRIIFSIIRKIFIVTFNILIFFIFLFLLFIRGPVLFLLNFFAVASAVSLFFLIWGSMLGGEISAKTPQ